jgi:hypothetical protein
MKRTVHSDTYNNLLLFSETVFRLFLANKNRKTDIILENSYTKEGDKAELRCHVDASSGSEGKNNPAPDQAAPLQTIGNIFSSLQHQYF